MKLSYFVVLLVGLLSGCAYIQGLKEPQEPITKQDNGVVIPTTAPKPIIQRSVNPAAAATKMIAPLTE